MCVCVCVCVCVLVLSYINSFRLIYCALILSHVISWCLISLYFLLLISLTQALPQNQKGFNLMNMIISFYNNGMEGKTIFFVPDYLYLSSTPSLSLPISLSHFPSPSDTTFRHSFYMLVSIYTVVWLSKQISPQWCDEQFTDHSCPVLRHCHAVTLHLSRRCLTLYITCSIMLLECIDE